MVFSFENLDNARAAYNKLIDRIVALLPQKEGEVDAAVFSAYKEKFASVMGEDKENDVRYQERREVTLDFGFTPRGQGSLLILRVFCQIYQIRAAVIAF